MLSALVACNKSGTASSAAPAAGANAAATPANSTSTNEVNAPTKTAGAAITFVSTQDDKPLVIDAALFDTPGAKEFLATGKNPYIGNAEAIAAGHKVFGMYSCTQCHGPEAKGQVGPGLVGPTFKYPKNATNKGMFETVWHGTNGGMGAKGKGLMDPTDASNGLTPDELLKVIAWIRTKGDGLTGNE
ncbi:MAG: c-type cytochrome [Bdellovibrio sp.]|nr:c-type cytochrome [Methylotenera sp.]